MILLLIDGRDAHAQSYQRKVTVEWEAIEGAKSYDLEFVKTPSTPTDKPLIVKSATAEWTGTMNTGTYMMRIRARDRRNVPGDWSGAEEFKVNLDTAKLLSPKSGEVLKTDQTTKAEINLSWSPVNGASEYNIEIISEDGSTKITKTVSENNVSLNLPISQKYTWKVLGIGGAYQSDATAVDEFSVWGKQIDTPVIEKPESEYVREIKWNTPEGATAFNYWITRFNAKDKKWELIEKAENVNTTSIPFKNEWIGGRYKITVNATGNMRPPSAREEIKFSVIDGNRSTEREYTQTLRQSIDRTNGYYAIASYLITTIDYKGQSRDIGGSTKFSALGGTGRFGLGYLSPVQPWGFLTVADFSGFYVGDKIYNFASLEMNGVYRRNTSALGESRHQIGLFYKELPEIRGNIVSGYSSTETLASAGPHYGYEFWRALTPKWGFQVNAHAYLSMFKMKTSNDQSINPSLSYQLGLLGSYRYRKNMTGLIGYAYRNDNLSYKVINALGDDDKNSVKIQGHYLNLFLEWAL